MLYLLLALACRSDVAPERPAEVQPCSGATVMVTADQTVTVDGRGCGSVTFDDVTILGEGDLKLQWFTDGESVVAELRAEGEATWEGLHAKGRWSLTGDAEPVLWRQGWQSWSASGVFPLEAPELVDGRPVAGGDDGTFEVSQETPGTSWWLGVVGRGEGAALGVGVSTARSSGFYTAFDPDGTVHAVWGARGERVPLSDGDVLYLDGLWAHFEPTPEGVVDRWASTAASLLGPRVTERPVTGWTSWYVFYDDVTEVDVRANLVEAMALRETGTPLDVIQIDDGWQRAWGDWSANEHFPSGMAAVAAEIREAGFRAGLWMAPFHVSTALPLVDDHPEWFLRTREGELHVDNGYYVLDATHPDASEWMGAQVSQRVAEGWDYLKLDFLHGGALNGVRHRPVSGIEAYQLGMRTLREAAGDAEILACGAPMLPTVGFAESWRSGPDIAFLVARDPELAFVRSQARATAARSFTNGLWWWVDADPVMTRSPADLALASGAAVVVAVSGGAWLAGDDLTSLPEERRALALPPAVMALRGTQVRPSVPLRFVSGFDTSPLIERAQGDDVVPTRWEWASGEVALLNLSEEPLTLEGPGGVELLSGTTASPGPRTLAPGAGEIWRP